MGISFTLKAGARCPTDAQIKAAVRSVEKSMAAKKKTAKKKATAVKKPSKKLTRTGRRPLVLQTILFAKTSHWTQYEMAAWLRLKGFHDVLDEDVNYWRARQVDPSKFVQKSFRTKTFSPGGIKAVLGHLK